MPRNPSYNKFDAANQYRFEIEQRTAQGETCEQIAAALRARGIEITNKTISRRRVQWGLRQRPFSKSMGQKVARPRQKKAQTKPAKQNARKDEIAARTARGESAEQIAAAMQAQGFEFKAGASSVLRLQTVWGLIPPDADRTRGKKRKSTTPKEPKLSKKEVRQQEREAEREANKQQQSTTLHYPTNCSFGPKKRANAALPQDGSVDVEPDENAENDDPPPVYDDGYSSPAMPAQQSQPTVSVAAELMSVEFLVDLANSTLGAATNLKDMLLAYQARRPVPGTLIGVPPTLEDLSTARKKVREAAAVMHDLAVEPSADT